MEIVCIDYLILERSKGGFEYVLVMTNHFSRYAQAFPAKNQTAKTAARVLFNNFFVHHGFPARIHRDHSSRNPSSNCVGLARWRSLEQHPTIQWKTAK